MKILFCIPRYHTNLHHQIKTLQDRGHAVSVTSLYRGASEFYGAVEPDVLGYSTVFLILRKIFHPSGSGGLKDSFDLKYGYPPLLKLWRRLRKINPDVVAVRDVESVYSFFAALFARLMGKKVIFLLQLPKYRAEKLKSGSAAFVGRFFRAPVITPLMGDAKYPNGNNNLFYVPFLHPLIVSVPKNVSGKTIRIISVGKFQKRKDQLLLLEAFRHLREKGYLISLTLVGEVAEPEYFKKVRENAGAAPLQGMVEIKTNLSWPAIFEEYKQHDIFVLPSYREAAAYSIIEAMAHGLPIITSDDNGTKEYVIPGENGYHFKARDLNDLEEKIELIIKDKSAIRRMSESSIAAIKTKYSPDEFYKRFLEALNWKSQ